MATGASGQPEPSDGINSGTLDGTVAEFCNLTGATPDQARFFLEAGSSQLERAVSMYYEQGGGRGLEESAVADQLPEAPPEASAASFRRFEQRHRSVFGILFGLPRAVFQTSFSILSGTLRLTASLAGLIGTNVLPAPVVHRLQGSVRSLTERRVADPQAAAADFVSTFARQFGDTHPRWSATSWSEATTRAHNQFKFLFVYLHSPGHQDAASFCQETLCDPDVVEYVDSHFLCWGGNIRCPDAFQLSQSLRVAAYPYVCLLAFSGSRTRLITAAEGHFSPDALLPVLREAQEQQAIHLVAEQADRNERDFNRRLREEQDAEYQRSLEADQERERQRQSASEATARARREAEQAAATERAAEEAERQRQADKGASIQARRERKKASLGSEPSSGTPGSVQVRVRLPDGSNHQHRFLAADSLQRAYDFVDSLDSLATLKYSLASSYPRRVFSGDALQQSFQELGLAPQAMLFVQPEDEE